MDKSFRLILTFFSVVAAGLLTIVVISLSNSTRAVKAADWVNHSHAFISEIRETMGSLNRAEGALNAYLITADPDHQADYRIAFGELGEHLEVAKALAAQSSEEANAVAELETLLLTRSQRAKAILTAYRNDDQAQLKATLQSAEDTEARSMIDRVTKDILDRQRELLNERDQFAFRDDNRARNALYVGSLLTALMLIGTAWFIRDDLAARRRAADLLARSNEELEIKVQERTAELVVANQKLREENLESRWSNQALEHQLRYSGLIINSLSEPILVITKALRVSRVNPAALRATQRDIVELVDHTLHDIIKLTAPGTNQTDSLAPLTEALQFGFDVRLLPVHLTVPGQPDQLANLNLFPLRDRDRVVGAVITLYLTPSSTS